MKKVKIFLTLLIVPQWVILTVLKQNPQWIEFYYSNGLYPQLFRFKHFFFNTLPISFGDLFYGTVSILALIAIVRWIQTPEKKIQPILLNWGAASSILILFFHLNWGFNYYRIPLNKKLNYSLKYNEEELTNTVNFLIETCNTLHDELSENDSLAITIPYTNKQLNELIKVDYSIGDKKTLILPSAKSSLWSTLLSYMGYAGYLNPLTLESQVNSKIPKISLVTTIAHEMAHQVGYAAENEANFIAFTNTIQNKDRYIQYAGYTFALRYCYAEFSQVNPQAAKEKIKTIQPGILKNFTEINTFWKAYTNPFEPFLKKGYDSYLKANGQKSGIQSYNEMVAYVIKHLKK